MKLAIVGLAVLVQGLTRVRGQAGFAPLPYSFIQPANHSCVIQDKLPSCPEQDPTKVDSCCVETYGGLVLSTEFWNTYSQPGQKLPAKTWTLHGLWPDFCNGSYTGYCDISRQYDPHPSPNVSSTGEPLDNYNGNVTGTNVLTRFGKLDLLDYMNRYWINRDASNDEFWMHEYSKHATCYSQYQIECYGESYVQDEEIPDFFENAIGAYKMYDTYNWLADAGITPSNESTYSLSDFEGALTQHTGALPYVGCSGQRYNETQAGQGSNDTGRTEISEVWYYNWALGNIRDLNYIAVNQTGRSSCARIEKALHYFTRSPDFEA